MRILLGQQVRDIVTGFEGTATSRVEFLNGCVRYAVQPRGLDKDGKPFENQYVDQEQIEVLGDGVRATLMLEQLELIDPHTPITGGPRPDPVRQADPPRR